MTNLFEKKIVISHTKEIIEVHFDYNKQTELLSCILPSKRNYDVVHV